MIAPVRVLPDWRAVAGLQVECRPGSGSHSAAGKQAAWLTPDPDPS